MIDDAIIKDLYGTLYFTETENIGKTHINAAHRILEELDKGLKDFREQQREIRKKVS